MILSFPLLSLLSAAVTFLPSAGAAASPSRSVVIVDQGNLRQVHAAAAGPFADALVSALAARADTRVFILSAKQHFEIPVRPGGVSASLAGTTGFLDDLQRLLHLWPAEAREIARGNSTVLDALVARECSAAGAAAGCGAGVAARGRAAVEAYDELANDTVRSLAAVVDASCRATRPPPAFVFLSPGFAYLHAPSRAFRDLAASLRGCGATLSIAQVVAPWSEESKDSGPFTVRAESLRDLGRPAGVQPRAFEVGNPAALASLADELVTARPAGVPEAPSHLGRAAAPASVALASAHVAEFAKAASVLVASEHYVQEVKHRPSHTSLPMGAMAGITVQQRVLDSEVALVQFVPDEVWTFARDVLRVDGRPLSEAERIPLASLHPRSIEEAVRQFAEVHRTGARYNIGGVSRDINLPTLALWFMTPQVLDRFAYREAGWETVDGVRCRVVNYDERETPYLLRAEFNPAPAHGRFWIAPDTGAVLRTELVLESARPKIGVAQGLSCRATLTTAYALNDRVHAWVPTEMLERFECPGRGDLDFVVGRAEYHGYHQFQVEMRLLPPK